MAYVWTLVAKMNGAEGANELKELIEPNLSEKQKQSVGPSLLALLENITAYNNKE